MTCFFCCLLSYLGFLRVGRDIQIFQVIFWIHRRGEMKTFMKMIFTPERAAIFSKVISMTIKLMHRKKFTRYRKVHLAVGFKNIKYSDFDEQTSVMQCHHVKIVRVFNAFFQNKLSSLALSSVTRSLCHYVTLAAA